MKAFKRAMLILTVTAVAAGILAFSLSGYIQAYAKSFILDDDKTGSGYDCILVLGCKVDDGEPSPLLRNRISKGIELYKKEVSSKMLMSGDNGRKEYDEVGVMKAYAVENGVPEEAIFTDHAGFSTYESMYRARDVFKAKRILIVTQEYHLYRAVYNARKLGLDAYGVAADDVAYGAQAREIREIFARDKDFIFTIIKPKPKYLGEPIDIKV